jgi:hypothetical protein
MARRFTDVTVPKPIADLPGSMLLSQMRICSLPLVSGIADQCGQEIHPRNANLISEGKRRPRDVRIGGTLAAWGALAGAPRDRDDLQDGLKFRMK